MARNPVWGAAMLGRRKARAAAVETKRPVTPARHSKRTARGRAPSYRIGHEAAERAGQLGLFNPAGADMAVVTRKGMAVIKKKKATRKKAGIKGKRQNPRATKKAAKRAARPRRAVAKRNGSKRLARDKWVRLPKGAKSVRITKSGALEAR